MCHPKLNMNNVSLSLIMYLFVNLFKELACTDRLNLHDFSID
jgi:hypothetical protein